MKRHIGAWVSGVAFAATFVAGGASAKTLSVGPSATYKTPCDAIAAAAAGDVVEIAPGTYTDSCGITVPNLTLRGVGGRPKIDLSGTDHPYFHQGIYVVQAGADGATFENLELMGAHVGTDYNANAGAIRIHAKDVTVRACYIHDNQNGIQGGADSGSAGTLLVEYTEFANNALGDGCNAGGCTHNVYANNTWDKVVFQYNYAHDIATDTADKGHLFKSRAQSNYILYNRITGENGHESYVIDLPNGGLSVVLGNSLEQGPHPDNYSILTYGLEGLSNADHRLFVVNNTFVNDADHGTFINAASGSTVTAHNNLFFGPGTMYNAGALPADNLSTTTPMFVDVAHYDYHLQSGSPAIDKGVDPGSADAYSLVPIAEYVHPLKSTPRKSDGKLDLGAFEYGTDTTVPLGDAGVPDGGPTGDASPPGDGGTHPDSGTAGDASGTIDTGSAQDDGGPTTNGDGGGGNNGGCSCTDAGAHGSTSTLSVTLGAMLAAALIVARRRRRESRDRNVAASRP